MLGPRRLCILARITRPRAGEERCDGHDDHALQNGKYDVCHALPSLTHLHGEHEEHHECRDDVADIDAVVAALELSREVGELLDTLMRGIDENLVGYGLHSLGHTGELLEEVRDGPADGRATVTQRVERRINQDTSEAKVVATTGICSLGA